MVQRLHVTAEGVPLELDIAAGVRRNWNYGLPDGWKVLRSI